MDHKNEDKVRRQVSGWYIQSRINVYIKIDIWEIDLIMETKLITTNEVNGSWKWDEGQRIIACLRCMHQNEYVNIKKCWLALCIRLINNKN